MFLRRLLYYTENVFRHKIINTHNTHILQLTLQLHVSNASNFILICLTGTFAWTENLSGRQNTFFEQKSAYDSNFYLFIHFDINCTNKSIPKYNPCTSLRHMVLLY